MFRTKKYVEEISSSYTREIRSLEKKLVVKDESINLYREAYFGLERNYQDLLKAFDLIDEAYNKVDALLQETLDYIDYIERY